MQQLDANYRKQLSYLGAVRCFDPTHFPPIVVCPYLGPTFDPGNNFYAMLLKVLVPTIVNIRWTDETLGDIVEAILATGMRPKANKAAQAVALWLESGAGLLYTVRCWFPQVHTTADLSALMDAAERFTDRRSGLGEFDLLRKDWSVA